ncbi:MAG: MBL fold metallo-hydrolase [Bacteroidota bacterium]
MKITFWGAAQTVTGSQHLVETERGTLLLDCGLYQGRREDARQLNSQFSADPTAIDAVVLSHAHIDHAGLLPKLWREGFRGRVFATHATRDLCALMLRDSGYIQQKDADFFNRKIRKKGQPSVEPLYTEDDAAGVMQHFVSLDYERAFEPLPGVEAVFRDAGHILGSATVTLTLEEEGREKRLGFTGDLGNPGRPILRDPAPLPPVDWLISESTYGGREHEPVDMAKERLGEIVRRTAARGGRVVVPAFAVGRTQELVYALDQLENSDDLPPIPVFVDSPLAVNATEIFRQHPECYDADLLAYLREDPNPFGWERLEYVRKAARSKELNEMRTPFVVISASGMAEHGRILHHLRHTISDPRSTVIIVGYQAEHTLGKRLVEKREEVRIFGTTHRRKMEVEVMNTFSAHADEPGLVNWIGELDQDRLERTFLVHGDPERQAKLTAALGRAGVGGRVSSPARGETVEV